LLGAVGTYAGLLKALGVNERESFIGAALVFLAIEGVVLYGALGEVVQIVRLALNQATCRVIAGPRNASVLLDGNTWRSDGMVWLGLVSSPGSTVNLTLRTPPYVRIVWRSRDANSRLWTRVGVDGGQVETWTNQVTNSQELEALGLFQIEMPDSVDPSSLRIPIEALGGTASGLALHHAIEVNVLEATAGAGGMRRLTLGE
jgi:hypothetical protein